jgi:hypothetical protein
LIDAEVFAGKVNRAVRGVAFIKAEVEVTLEVAMDQTLRWGSEVVNVYDAFISYNPSRIAGRGSIK